MNKTGGSEQNIEQNTRIRTQRRTNQLFANTKSNKTDRCEHIVEQDTCWEGGCRTQLRTQQELCERTHEQNPVCVISTWNTTSNKTTRSNKTTDKTGRVPNRTMNKTLALFTSTERNIKQNMPKITNETSNKTYNIEQNNRCKFRTEHTSNKTSNENTVFRTSNTVLCQPCCSYGHLTYVVINKKRRLPDSDFRNRDLTSAGLVRPHYVGIAAPIQHTALSCCLSDPGQS